MEQARGHRRRPGWGCPRSRLLEQEFVVIEASADLRSASPHPMAQGHVTADPESAGGAPRTGIPQCCGVESLLQARPGGRLVTSLDALSASGTVPDLTGARRAVVGLDVADYEASVDVRDIAAETPFEIVWSPVTAVVDLMLDWDLPELEITLTELAEWLDVEVAIADRALERLARYPGVTVCQVGDGHRVRLGMDLNGCPLTASPPEE